MTLLAGVLAVMTAAQAIAAPRAVELYVSPSGNDRWSGKSAAKAAKSNEGPFRSLTRAQNAVRDLKRSQGGRLHKPVTIWVRGGTYILEQTLLLEAADSGSPGAVVEYAAYRGEKPVISGGRRIQGWKRDPRGAWTVTIPGVKSPRHLFVNGVRSPRSRQPNAGFLQGLATKDAQSLTFPEGQLRSWSNPKDVELVTLVEWSQSRVRLSDARVEGNVATFPGAILPFWGAPWAGHIMSNAGRFPYFFENAPEMLDSPGEWYLNRTTGQLSYLPLPKERESGVEAVLPHLETLVRIRGSRTAPVAHLAFRGLTFSHTGWTLPLTGYMPAQAGFGGIGATLPAAVEVEYARGWAMEGCRLQHLGGSGVRLGRGSQETRIERCEISDVSANGVEVGVREATAEQQEDLVRGTRITNSKIHHCAVEHVGCVGVWVGIAPQTVIAHNEIAHLPYSGISIGWKWDQIPTPARDNVLEFNHIHHVVGLLSDGGGIYTLGFQPGSVMRGNLIHDVGRSPTVAHNNGIFLDNGSKGWRIDDNILYGIPDGPTRQNADPSDSAWGTNSLNVAPGEPNFPAEAAAKAGPQSRR